MWFSLRRQRLTIICHRWDVTAFALRATFTLPLFAALIPDAWAEEDQISKAGQVARSIIIREHAGWNEDCDGVEPPPVYLLSRPQHGKVCARNEQIKIASMYAGTQGQCIGRLVRGIRLIYQPESDFAGEDSLLYAVQYPAVLRTIAVKVLVAGYETRTSHVSPSDAAVSSKQTPRSMEPIPACTEFLF